MKKGIIPKLLGRLASSRKFYTLVRLASRVGLRPGPWFRKHFRRDGRLPVSMVSGPARIRRSQQIGELVELLKETEMLVCASERFWLEHHELLMKFLPPNSREFLAGTRTSLDLGDAVRVPLRRYESGSFEAWVQRKGVTVTPGCLLVLDGCDVDRAAVSFQGWLPSRQKVLVVSDGLPDELKRSWQLCTRIADGLWLLQGPPNGLQRIVRPVEPTGGWPKISIVTVSYNQAPYIRSCLESILCQGYPNLEYIVVDGDSSDGTKEILECYRDQLSLLIIEPDRGQSDALNKGFRSATGDVMTWVCSDDLLEPDSLFYVGRAFAQNEVDVVAGGCRIIDGKGRLLHDHHNGLPFGQVADLSFGDLLSFLGVWQRGMFFNQPEVFFSRRIWEASGAYVKERLHFVMDYDLFLRMAMAGASILHIPQYIGVSRRHKHQKTQHSNMLYLPTVRALLEEYRNMLDRMGEALEREYHLPESVA